MSKDLEMDVKEPLAGKSSEPSPSKVQFVSSSPDGKNCEAKVSFDGFDGTKVGLNKDELMKYANDPFWVKVRMISFILFWVAWLATLVGSTVIIFYAPKCPAQPDLASTVAGSITTLVTMMDNSTNAPGAIINALASTLTPVSS
uniref:Solute carrier family 3 member 2 N-terminal domain-containing protein n=1 Tax=Tetranychus urticae TaxID=32264 RepID=T1K8M8_TETUR